jgi:hypothetical protein
MSFIAMQTVIARLCVDRPFRQSFRRDADGALQAHELSPEEVDTVKAIDVDAVDSYAERLMRKRMATIAKWFPLTFAALRKGLPNEQRLEVIHEYGYGTFRSSDDIGGDWVKSESAAFARYVNGLIERGALAMPWLSDLLELEQTRRAMLQDPAASASSRGFAKGREIARFGELQAQGRPLLGQHASLRRFNCNVVELIAQVEKAETLAPPAPASTWVLFVKRPRRSRIRLQTVTRPVREVLELCDGTKPTAEILDHMVSRYATAATSADDVRSDCRHMLEACYKAGIVTFVAAERAGITTAAGQ